MENFSKEDLKKKNNQDLLGLINKYADLAETKRQKMIQLLDEMENAEKIYMLALETLNERQQI